MKVTERFKKHINHAISLALAIIIVYIAISRGEELSVALKQVDVRWALAGLACYAMNYFLRACRFQAILRSRIRLWPNAVYTACLHGLATYLLPLRSGDLTLPVILSRVSPISFLEGTLVLIKARFLDLSALGIWILFAALFIDLPIPKSIHILWMLFGIGLSILPIVIPWGVQLSKKRSGKLWQWLAEWGSKVSIRTDEYFLSIGIWGCVSACFFCTSIAIGLPLHFVDVWLLITIQLPLQLIPLQGVANAGNHEGSWVVGLTLLGISAHQGMHFALLSHALILTYVLMLGPFSFFIKVKAKHRLVQEAFCKPDPN